MMTVKVDGTYCSLGVPPHFDVTPGLLTLGRRSLTSSATGGMAEAREMLAFSAEHGIYPEVEFIRPDQIHTALERLRQGDVRYRFVMDMTGGL